MINEPEFLDFLYIGAPRSGSTWLAGALNEHPEIWIPHNKEVHFFNSTSLYPFEYKYPKGIKYYKKYFEEAPKNIKLGELSPLYYFDPNAAYKIYKHFPNVKIIAILRHPVEVVFSSYLKRYQMEPRKKSFELELIKNPCFINLGFYHRLLTPYFDFFPKEQIYVRIFEDFFVHQKEEIKQIYTYLGVDNRFIPSIIGKKINVTAPPQSIIFRYLNKLSLTALNMPRFIYLKNILHKLKINKVSFKPSEITEKFNKPELNKSTIRELMEQFDPDIKRLEKLLERNLDIWREV